MKNTTKNLLRKIIKEEVKRVLSEEDTESVNKGTYSNKKMTLKQIEKEMDELEEYLDSISRGGSEYDSAMAEWDELNAMKKKLKK